jgi:hypothetical protein
MDHCPICFEYMDMVAFQDERAQTETCVKLKCHHAYHTLCIIDCMSRMDYKCVQCNAEKDPSTQLTRKGLATTLLNEIKRDAEIKRLIAEVEEAKDELHMSVTQLKKDIKEYAKTRSTELHVPEKRKYFMDCIFELRKTTNTIAKNKGTQYVGALKQLVQEERRYYLTNVTDTVFFGRHKARTFYRLKYPHLYMSL